jgi:hypothetical protein
MVCSLPRNNPFPLPYPSTLPLLYSIYIKGTSGTYWLFTDLRYALHAVSVCVVCVGLLVIRFLSFRYF